MADLNSAVYDFVYFLALFFFLVWLIRTLWHTKELAILSAATEHHSLALLHDLLAIQPRVTHELLLSHLRKQSSVSEHDVPQLVLPATLLSARSRATQPASETEEMYLRVCARVEARVECYVGVPRRLLSRLYHNYDAFNQRPHLVTDKQGAKTDKSHTSTASHKQQVKPTPAPSSDKQPTATLLYAGESEWSAVQRVSVALSSTHVFHVPSAVMRRVRADAALLPVVVVVRAETPQRAVGSAGQHPVTAHSGVELVAAASTKKQQREQLWLASLPHSPDLPLVHLSILNSPLPSSSSPASPSGAVTPFTLDSQLVVQPAARRVWHMNDIYGLTASTADDAGGGGGSSSECLVCMSEAKCVLLLPCRHLCVCVECFDSFQQQKCPVCRAPLEEWCVVTEDESGEARDGAKQMQAATLKAD